MSIAHSESVQIKIVSVSSSCRHSERNISGNNFDYSMFLNNSMHNIQANITYTQKPGETILNSVLHNNFRSK